MKTHSAALADNEIRDLPVELRVDGPLRLPGELAVVGQERGKRYLREYMETGERTLQPVKEFRLVRGQQRFAADAGKATICGG
jgi:hypothetical protein